MKQKNTFITNLLKFSEKKNTLQIQKELEDYKDRQSILEKRKLEFNNLKTLKITETLNYNVKGTSSLFYNNDIYLSYTNGDIFKNNQLFFKNENTVIFTFLYDEIYFIDTVGNLFRGKNCVYRFNTRIISCDLHKELGIILFCDINNEIFCFDLKNNQPIFKNYLKEQRHLKIHEYGNIFLGVSNKCNLFDIRTMKIVHTFCKNTTIASFFTPNYVISCTDNIIDCYDMRMLKLCGKILSHKNNINLLECNKFVYTTSLEGEICVSSPVISVINKEVKVEKCKFISWSDDKLCVVGNNVKIFGCD
ncbi:hypothetical protein TUBRATIS_004610 [Tubulinosema ratisbonensis]|uniref:Uncharacterized protein n=1 Tax=Tubulinosema ratisbonensis TaxID=291195 RepID=A0A437APF9_9MICR|nr:hypothetical protein TUBRATIS_004610 [Tubulinosema ratisbonensis]